jgi:hypothetical protein
MDTNTGHHWVVQKAVRIHTSSLSSGECEADSHQLCWRVGWVAWRLVKNGGMEQTGAPEEWDSNHQTEAGWGSIQGTFLISLLPTGRVGWPMDAFCSTKHYAQWHSLPGTLKKYRFLSLLPTWPWPPRTRDCVSLSIYEEVHLVTGLNWTEEDPWAQSTTGWIPKDTDS